MVNRCKPSRFNILITRNDKFYVVNTLTGAVCELETDEYYALETNDYSGLGNDSTDEMKRLGLIIDESLDEIGLLRFAYSKARYNKNKARLTICTTLECNFACPYCYERRQSGSMSPEVEEGIIHYVKELISSGIKLISIIWYGGEPLLYPEIIERLSCRIASLCKENQVEYTCSMISNGFLINNRVLKMFETIGLSTIQITVDGDEKTHNSRRRLKNGDATYQQIMDNIQKLSSVPIQVVVRVNIDKTNIDTFSQVKNAIGKQNPEAACLPAIVTQEETQSAKQRSRCFSFEEHAGFYKRFMSEESFVLELDKCLGQGIATCSAEHYYSCVIDPNGFRYQCLNEVGNPEYAIASVLDDAYCGESAIAKYFGRDPFSEKECCDCVYLPLCYGRCVWEYKKNGVHSCVAAKYIFDDMVDRELSLYCRE